MPLKISASETAAEIPPLISTNQVPTVNSPYRNDFESASQRRQSFEAHTGVVIALEHATYHRATASPSPRPSPPPSNASDTTQITNTPSDREYVAIPQAERPLVLPSLAPSDPQGASPLIHSISVNGIRKRIVSTSSPQTFEPNRPLVDSVCPNLPTLTSVNDATATETDLVPPPTPTPAPLFAGIITAGEGNAVELEANGGFPSVLRTDVVPTKGSADKMSSIGGDVHGEKRSRTAVSEDLNIEVIQRSPLSVAALNPNVAPAIQQFSESNGDELDMVYHDAPEPPINLRTRSGREKASSYQNPGPRPKRASK